MSATSAPPSAPPALHTDRGPTPRWRDPHMLQTVAFVAVTAAAGWYLLNALAPILRPLMVAVFLTYVLMPYHSRLRKRVPAPVSIVLLAGLTAAVLVLVALVVYASVLGLNEELPRLEQRVRDLGRYGDELVRTNAPWLSEHAPDGKGAERLLQLGGAVAGPILNAAGNALVEACVVALYLMFLLLGASRLPDRVRDAYPPDRAETILHVAGQVNAAIISYLRAKVKSSLLLAVPVGLVLWSFGVKFALLWAVLTFLCNFIPYLGSVVAYTLPVGFAFLQLELNWQPFTVAGLVLVCHLASASVIEPMLLGHAVGLSPLVILGSLAFWGLVWGVPGMFLAVPLTVVATIVMSQFEFTRPLAKLVSGD